MNKKGCSICNANYTFGPLLNSGIGGSRSKSQSGPTRCPKILKCGHTFCENCLSQITKKVLNVNASKGSARYYIICPDCKQKTFLKKDVAELPTNFYVIAHIATNYYQRQEDDLNIFSPTSSKKLAKKALQEMSNEDDKKCSMCLERRPTCECKECENILCKKCFEMAHRVSAAIRHHKPIEITESQEMKLKIETLCKEHNRPIEYFCFQDNIPICAKCIINGVHKSHDIKSFEELNQPIVDRIQEELPTVLTVLSHLQRIDRKVLSIIMPSYKTETKSIISNINACFSHLHALLQLREQELIEGITNSYLEGLNTLEDSRIFYEQVKNKLEKSIKEAKQLIDDNALVVDAKHILEELVKSKDIQCILNEEDLVNSCLAWEEAGLSDLHSSILSFGKVSGELNDKVKLKTLEDGDLVTNYNLADLANPVSSILSSLDYQKSETSSKTPSVITDNSSDIVDDDTDGDTTSSRSSTSFKKELLTLPCVKGQSQDIVIVHINSPNSFYVQLLQNKNKLESLSHNMNIWCRSPSSNKHIPLTVERHMLVLAKFSVDNRWYRARVLNVDELKDEEQSKSHFKIHVVYIDFGNEETVDFKDLRIMQDRYMIYPEFKVHCSLYDIAPLDENGSWDSDTIEEFNEITNQKILSMNAIENGIDGFEIDLRYAPKEDVCDDQFVSVRDVLIFRELARFKHHSDQAKYQPEIPSYSKERYISVTKLKSGTVVDCDISRAANPWDFHITVRGEEQEYFRHMANQIQLLYNGGLSSLYLLYYPRCGVLCAAKSSNGHWYRSQVLSAPNKSQVEVLLVDTGETTTVHCDMLRKLSNEFIKLPVRAIPCRLVDLAPCDREWSDEAKLWTSKTMPMSIGKARIVSWGPPTEVVLWLGLDKDPLKNASINALLTQAKLAISTGPASLPAAGISQEDLPHSPQRKTKALRKMRGPPSTCSSSSTVTSPNRTSLQNSPISSPPKKVDAEASSMMKAKTQLNFDKKEPAGAIREMKDHNGGGENDETSALIGVTVTRKKRPPLVSKKLSLKTEEHRRRSDELAKRRQEEQNKEALEKSKQEKLQVEIHRSISGEDRSPGEPYQGNPYIRILMTYFVSPSDFRIRVINGIEDQLKPLMQGLQIVCQQGNGSTVNWNLGDACAVRNPDDKQWYRGEIRVLDPKGVAEVELIDTGFNVKVDTSTDLQILPDDFKKTAGAAFRCCLADLLPAGSTDGRKWSSTACDFMKGQLTDKNLYVQLKGDQIEWGWPIDIIIEEVVPETAFDPASRSYHSLRQLILDEGLAMPSKKPSPQPTNDGINPFIRTLSNEECNSPAKVQEETKSAMKVQEKLEQPSLNFSSDLGVKPEVQVRSKGKAAPVILPPIPNPPVGSTMKVIPTYVDHQGVIFCQPMAWGEVIVHLSEELQRVYQNATYTPLLWEKGQLCVAKFPDDDLWYRACILEIKQSAIKVQYIDYGNSAWVPRQLVLEMQEGFDHHLLAYYCILEDAEPITGEETWPIPTLNHLHDLIVNNESVIAVNTVSPKFIWVSLTNSNGDQFPQYLFSKKLAVDTGDLTEAYTRSRAISKVWASLPFPTLNVEDLCPHFFGQVTHVELPNLIYLQRLRIPESRDVDIVTSGEVAEMNNQITAFEQMAKQLNICKSMPLMKLPDVGSKCAGKFSFDNCWYRAVCVARYPTQEACLLVYVDYGNSEMVSLANMRSLPTEFWSFPAQSIRCFFNIKPPANHGNVFRQSTLKGVIENLVTKELEAKIIKKSPVTVDLFQESEAGSFHLAYENLITSGLALLPTEVKSSCDKLIPESDPSNILGEIEDETEGPSPIIDYFDKTGDGDTGLSVTPVYLPDEHTTIVTEATKQEDYEDTVDQEDPIQSEGITWYDLYDKDGDTENNVKKAQEDSS